MLISMQMGYQASLLISKIRKLTNTHGNSTHANGLPMHVAETHYFPSNKAKELSQEAWRKVIKVIGVRPSELIRMHTQ
jgi:hypothetical protein